jgi:hypothetical protein
MGVTIQFESHRAELAFIYEMEHNTDVLEYYDHAPSIRLDYQSASERHLGASGKYYAGATEMRRACKGQELTASVSTGVS